MKPLTIEQLKALEVGDWVWLVSAGYGGEYVMVKGITDNCIHYETLTMRNCRHFLGYGTKWLAYKNKEQAEAEEYKIDFDANGGWEVRKYIPAHYQAWFTAETKEEAEHRLAELKGE